VPAQPDRKQVIQRRLSRSAHVPSVEEQKPEKSGCKRILKYFLIVEIQG
jgi:hypothetical protein